MNVPVGLNLPADDDFRRASYPLFEAGLVDVLEYSFDTQWGREPEWLGELVDYYGAQGALLGHGVHFSALSGRIDRAQEVWLDNLKAECQRRQYRHISEHFGFATSASFHQSAPLPVPRTRETQELGLARLRQLRAAARVPIGLENLAFAFGPQDVREQGAFLEELLAPVDGFLLLDLHNIYCQTWNFGARAEELLHSYPLARVRELHVSGGSWSEAAGERVRRDTHDGAVPEEVFALVELALRLCPHVQAVIFERMGGTLDSDAESEQFRTDFLRLREIAAAHMPLCPEKVEHWQAPAQLSGHNDEELWAFQSALLELLSQPLEPSAMLRRLREGAEFAGYRSYVESFDLRSVAVAAELTRKWGKARLDV